MELNEKDAQGILGKVNQYPLTHNQQFKLIKERWHALVRNVALFIGVNTDNMFVVDEKLLLSGTSTSNKSTIDQATHFDSAREAASSSKYSVLLVCSNGSHATALPTFKSNNDLSFNTNPIVMQTAARVCLNISHTIVSLSIYCISIVIYNHLYEHQVSKYPKIQSQSYIRLRPQHNNCHQIL